MGLTNNTKYKVQVLELKFMFFYWQRATINRLFTCMPPLFFFFFCTADTAGLDGIETTHSVFYIG